MSYLFLFLSLLFVSQTTDPQPPGLSITTTAEVELPADQIQFNINVNAEAQTPQEAYNLHQQREKALVKLLDQYKISEEDIGYEPISIAKNQNYNRNNEGETTYQTRQMVHVTLEDFSIYEKIQIRLIEAGFDNFSGQFTSTEFEEGKEQALRKAIQQAKSKAEIIAEETGIDLGTVLNINYNYEQVQPYARETLQMKAQSDTGSLLKYNQTVTVSASISIEFAILQDE